MKKILAANQQQRQQHLMMQQDDTSPEVNSLLENPSSSYPTSIRDETIVEGKKTESSTPSIISKLPLQSHMELLSGVPIVGGMTTRHDRVSVRSNGPESPPDAMDLVSMAGDTNVSDPATGEGVGLVGPNKSLQANVSTPPIRSLNHIDDGLRLTSETGDQVSRGVDHVNDNSAGKGPLGSKMFNEQQKSVVLERRTDLHEDGISNLVRNNPPFCAKKSDPISSCDEPTQQQPQVPIVTEINTKVSVHPFTITSNVTTSSTTSNKITTIEGHSVNSAKNPYLMKKQSFLLSDKEDYSQNYRDFDQSDNNSSADKLISVNQENPSMPTPLDNQTDMAIQSQPSVVKMAGTDPIHPPVIQQNGPSEAAVDASTQNVTNVKQPSQSPEESPLSSPNKAQATKHKEELTKEEREQQRRNRINAFSEWQKRQKEELAKKDEERKMEQERRRQEEIAQIEQRKRLKSVRIPKRSKEFSPLVSPNPSSPDSLMKSSALSENTISGLWEKFHNTFIMKYLEINIDRMIMGIDI